MKKMLPEGLKNTPPYSHAMEMSEFEKRLCMQEKMERHLNTVQYQMGIQGRDGGYCHKDLVR